MSRALLTAALMALCVVPAAAIEDLIVQREERVIPPGETVTYDLPPVDAKGQRVVLEFEARMENPKPGGSLFYLDLKINGEPVAAARDRLACRLLNKPLGVPYKEGAMLYWYAAGTGWRVVYAPDFESFGQSHGPDPYRFVIDVTDLLDRQQANQMSFHRVVGTNQSNLVIRNVTLRSAEEGTARKTSQYALKGAVEPKVSVSENGAVVIAAGEREYRIISDWSWPGAGFNGLGSESATSRWQVKVTPQGPGSWVVEGTDPAYRLRRSVTLADGRVRVRDELRNVTDKPIGVINNHTVGLGTEPVPVIYLGGIPDPTVTDTPTRGNTTVFVPLGDFGLGVALEDDASRCQATLFASPDALSTGWRNNRLAVAPGETYAMEWSLYPCQHGDYWRFINRVRADWGVNGVTVQGPYAFIQPIRYGRDETDVAALREQLEQGQQWGIITGGGWHYDDDPQPKWLAFGVGIFSEPFEEYRRLLKRAIENFKQADPAAKFMVYVHCFYNSPQTEEEKQRFKDSWITGANGEQRVWGWGDTYRPSPMVFPTLSNSFGPAFLQACERLLEEYGATGLYLDESNGGHAVYTYNAWDGRSAEIDPQTHDIKALVGHPTLMSVPVRLALQKMTDERGAGFIANGHPYVMTENRAHFPRFVEAQHLVSRAAETHLYTPLIWEFGTYTDTSRLRRSLKWGTIPMRLNLSVPGGPLARCYPLTATEVHEGWILGRERIIISDSGRYGWPGETVKARVYGWDADLKEQPVREMTVDGKTEITIPAGGVGVIERM